jgi:hypothetical protein
MPNPVLRRIHRRAERRSRPEEDPLRREDGGSTAPGGAPPLRREEGGRVGRPVHRLRASPGAARRHEVRGARRGRRGRHGYARGGGEEGGGVERRAVAWREGRGGARSWGGRRLRSAAGEGGKGPRVLGVGGGLYMA